METDQYSSYESSCRFCLRVLQEDEKQIAINHYIRKQFLVITQTELKSSELYSQIICETCFNSTLEFTNFKASLIESQQKLEESVEVLEADITDEPDCEDVIEMVLKSETVFCNKKIGQNPVKVESLDESCEDESEECDEIDLHTWKDVAQQSESSKPKKYSHQSIKEESSCTIGSSDKKKMCDICGMWLNTMAFKRHYDRIHLMTKNYCCDYCGFRVFKKFDLNNHIRSHLKIKSHYCEHCPACFTTKTGLRTHSLVHSSDRNFVCDVDGCKAAFKSKGALQRHVNSHRMFRKYECIECNRKFADSYKLKLHKQSVHLPPDSSQKTPCPICQKLFKTREVMKKHLVYHKSPEFRCELCNKEFYVLNNLKAHNKSVHGGLKEFYCKYCSNSYFKNSHLNRHILTAHMKQKIYCQVEGCEHHFPRKERYKAHLMTQHQNINEHELNILIEGVKTVEVTYEDIGYELNATVFR